MTHLSPFDRGVAAAREAMITMGRPGAIDWLIRNNPSNCTAAWPEDKPLAWWAGFDREIGSVSGTA